MMSTHFITYGDAKCIRQIMEYVKECFNPFVVGEISAILNIVTMSHVQAESTDVLLQCLEHGERSCSEFYWFRLVENFKASR